MSVLGLFAKCSLTLVGLVQHHTQGVDDLSRLGFLFNMFHDFIHVIECLCDIKLGAGQDWCGAGQGWCGAGQGWCGAGQG